MSVAPSEKLMTIEEFSRLPDDGRPKELVRGRIVFMNVPGIRHGEICSNIVLIVGNFVREHDRGRVVSNDSGVVTDRSPDTVRGPDVSYYSYTRMLKGPGPSGYHSLPPEIAFEVRSPHDAWSEIIGKVAELLTAGIATVCVFDPETESVHLYFGYKPVEVLHGEQELTFSGILDEFSVAVEEFFH